MKSKCPKLIGVAGSAGNSTNFKKESSASLSRGNSFSQFFTTNLPTITLDVDQVGFGEFLSSPKERNWSVFSNKVDGRGR